MRDRSTYDSGGKEALYNSETIAEVTFVLSKIRRRKVPIFAMLWIDWSLTAVRLRSR